MSYRPIFNQPNRETRIINDRRVTPLDGVEEPYQTPRLFSDSLDQEPIVLQEPIIKEQLLTNSQGEEAYVPTSLASAISMKAKTNQAKPVNKPAKTKPQQIEAYKPLTLGDVLKKRRP